MLRLANCWQQALDNFARLNFKTMTLDNLNDWLNDLRYLITDIKVCVRNGLRIPNNVYENEEKLKQMNFFSDYQFQLAFICGIQLSKMLSDSDSHRRNFHKLFTQLESESYDNHLKQKLKLSCDKEVTREELLNEIKRFKKILQNKKELIDLVIHVRDKAYAHHDPKRKEFGPSFAEYEELVEMCCLIWNGLNQKITGQTTIFDVSNFDIDPIIRHAAKSYTSMIDQRNKKV